MTDGARFRRVVLEVGQDGADPAAIRAAADLARRLNAVLHALFVTDEGLLNWAALPFSREISSLSHQWRTLDAEQTRAELRATAGHVRQRLAETARELGVPLRFETREGDVAAQLEAFCVETDIVVVAAGQFALTLGARRARGAADRSAASVLLLPRRPPPQHGPVVVFTGGQDDPTAQVARDLARAMGERLIVLPAGAAADSMTLAAALSGVTERLIVTDDADQAEVLVVTRGVPVLVAGTRPA